MSKTEARPSSPPACGRARACPGFACSARRLRRPGQALRRDRHRQARAKGRRNLRWELRTPESVMQPAPQLVRSVHAAKRRNSTEVYPKRRTPAQAHIAAPCPLRSKRTSLRSLRNKRAVLFAPRAKQLHLHGQLTDALMSLTRSPDLIPRPLLPARSEPGEGVTGTDDPSEAWEETELRPATVGRHPIRHCRPPVYRLAPPPSARGQT